MPIATPIANNLGVGFSSSHVSSGECLSPCASPNATPKVNVPLSTANDSSCDAQNWSQGDGAMPQMMYAPTSDAFGCPPPAPVFMTPMLCMMDQHGQVMMDQNGQVMQIPCPMDQGGQMVWTAPTNAFHMMQPGNDSWESQAMQMQTMYNENSMAETDISLAEKVSGAPCNDAPHNVMPAEIDWREGSQCSHEPYMPQSDTLTLDEDVAALGSPRKMLVDAELLAYVEEQLENSTTTKRKALLVWMQSAVVDLALSAKGTRIVQKALEVPGGESLTHFFHGRVKQLLDSHHGNHVLQKSIVALPPHAIHFILHELSFCSGGWPGVVKHRFGCRVVERLFEHCQPEVTAPIVAAMVTEIEVLSKHPFANYVVQHILEYAPAHRHQVVSGLILVGVPFLAQHRVASNIIERAFEHGDAKIQGMLAEAVLTCPYAIVEMGCSRYGSFTVRRMLDALHEPLLSMAMHQLGDPQSLRNLRAAKHGRHIASRVEKRLRAAYMHIQAEVAGYAAHT